MGIIGVLPAPGHPTSARVLACIGMKSTERPESRWIVVCSTWKFREYKGGGIAGPRLDLIALSRVLVQNLESIHAKSALQLLGEYSQQLAPHFLPRP